MTTVDLQVQEGAPLLTIYHNGRRIDKVTTDQVLAALRAINRCPPAKRVTAAVRSRTKPSPTTMATWLAKAFSERLRVLGDDIAYTRYRVEDRNGYLRGHVQTEDGSVIARHLAVTTGLVRDFEDFTIKKCEQ